MCEQKFWIDWCYDAMIATWDKVNKDLPMDRENLGIYTEWPND